MRSRRSVFLLLPIFACTLASAQFKHTSVPAGDAVAKALEKSSLTAEDSRPFHLRITITEPENPQSPYEGTIEEWWQSKDRWRREVTAKGGIRQTIVVADGKQTEHDEGDYFPLWLHSFVTAAFNPVPSAEAIKQSGATIDQMTLPDGRKSSPNIRFESLLGTGDRATKAYTNISFDSEGRLSFYGSPRYSMEFNDYRGFGKKQIARQLVDNPEPGTKLVGVVTVLEDESKAAPAADRFTPLATADNRFNSVQVSSQQLEQFTTDSPAIVWPTVHSGNTSGRLAVYIGVDDQGQVREAWPLNSDNAGLEDPAREQIRKWKLKPAVNAGKAVQFDGGLGFSFSTKIENPLPVLSGDQIQPQLSGCTYNSVLPAGILPKGTKATARLSINEKGAYVGSNFSGIPGFKALEASGLRSPSCHFKPYLVNGQPTYYYMDLTFTAP